MEGPSASERELRERLHLALEATGLGVWDWDVATEQVAWDERCRAMFGLPDAERTVSTGTVLHAIHPDDRAGVVASRRGAEGGAPVDQEFRVRWPDGGQRLVMARGQVLRDAAGRPSRLVGVTLDVTEHRREAAQRGQDAARMAGLVAAAQELGGAGTEDDVLGVVTKHTSGLLGAQGSALCLVEEGGAAVRVLTTSFVPEPVRDRLQALPADFPMPMVRAAVSGEAVFLTDRAAAEALVPGAGRQYAASATEASAAVPLRGAGARGALSCALAVPHAWRRADRELLAAFAALTAQALERIRARADEAAAAAEVAGMSEALQRSLLTEPPAPDHLQVVVRYRPASAVAQVGGDWYDAFVQRDGATVVVIGDVVGHDSVAAAAMGQVRNVLRAVAVHTGDGPAAVLTSTDRLLRDLVVETTATAVVARFEQDAEDAARGVRVLRWSSAGHPPPVVVGPGGEVELLTGGEPDLLLGLDPDERRAERTTDLAPGSTLLLYTDGLVERRQLPLQDGLDQLCRVLAELAAASPSLDELVDAALERLLGGEAEDDAALLAVRVHPPR